MATLLDAYQTFEHAFENALPVPQVIDARNGKNVTLQVRETSQFLGLYDENGNALLTTVWGYGQGNQPSYPGPTILAAENVPVTVQWQNKLPVSGHLLPVDTTIHIAHSLQKPLSEGFVPIVSHLHGGHNEARFDGTPEQWFTQSGHTEVHKTLGRITSVPG
jgi:spore coat protein A